MTNRALLGIAAMLLAARADAVNWVQFGFDPNHSAYNPRESSIAANLSNLHLQFQVPLPEKSEGSPVYVSGVSAADGWHDMVFVTTIAGRIVAIDARNGEIMWQQQAQGTASATMSSPAIDPSLLYVYSFGLDGKVHKYATADGTETIDASWPEVVTLKPEIEKGSSALTFATVASGKTYLYATTSNSNSDSGDYQGHITAIDLASGEQRVFNTLCSDKNVHFAPAPAVDCDKTQSGIWGRPSVVYDPWLDRIFTTTGNGPFSGDTGGFDWGESVIALSPSLLDDQGQPLRKPLDSFTPPEHAALDAIDYDLGQTIPAILPAPAGSKYPHLAVQLGKDGIIRLLNLENLSGKGAPGNTGGDLQQVTGLNFTPFFSSQPAVWTDPDGGLTWLFAVNNGAVYAFILTVDASGNPGLVQMWSRTAYGGSSAIVADGLLIYAEQSFNLVAVDAKTGDQLWSSPTSWAHWASPIAVDGKIFLPDGDATLRIYGTDEFTASAVGPPPPRVIVPPRLPPPFLRLTAPAESKH